MQYENNFQIKYFLLKTRFGRQKPFFQKIHLEKIVPPYIRNNTVLIQHKSVWSYVQYLHSAGEERFRSNRLCGRYSWSAGHSRSCDRGCRCHRRHARPCNMGWHSYKQKRKSFTTTNQQFFPFLSMLEYDYRWTKFW